MKPFLILICVFSLFSCSTPETRKWNDLSGGDIGEIISANDKTTVRFFSSNSSKRKRLKETKKFNGEIYSELGFHKNSEVNEKVKWWINHFITDDRERFQRVMNRGEEFREILENILEENGLPKDLYYLAFVESGFVVKAKSSASAQGVWQFMKGTGKQYGLVVDNYLDERNDPIRSTQSASRYLRKLYSAYNSWELALAAYNAGEYRVLSSIMKGESRNYWTLCEKKILPKETRNYVPKIIASRHVAKNWRKYGFSEPRSSRETYPDLEMIEVPSPIRLSTVSKKLGLDLKSLERFNPHLRRGVTSPNYRTYELWVPQNEYEIAVNSIYRLSPERVSAQLIKRRYASDSNRNYYIVRSGDTLSGIARKNNTSINHLMALNNLSSKMILVGQKLRVTQKSYVSSSSKDSYRVRHGDTLSGISAKFNIRMSNLRKYNNLDGNKIFVGQYLALRKKNYHRVRSGENLSSISRKYGQSVYEIKRKNKLRSSRIYPGQLLKI